MQKPEERFFTIGFRHTSALIIAIEPWSEPRCEWLEDQIRPYGPMAQFDGEQVAARCAVGSEDPEIVGSTMDDLVRAQLRWHATAGAKQMEKLLAHLRRMDLATIARLVIAGADLAKPVPLAPEEIELRDDPLTAVEQAVGLRAGYITQGPEGTKIVLPGIPRNIPLAGWANGLLRQRAAEAILAVVAERSIDAS